ncbi:MAG: right-handed parallel beta-helix repeat-containing protein [Deltaproteobacteria bacterium]|nr:right-handed parallel beta-helix repeat-containing protein [Deltaproteobacteria bacterium]
MGRVGIGIAAALLLLQAARPAAAAELHVATNGDDQAPGDAAAPFRTIRRGLDAARAGDTIYLHAGVYAEGVSTEDGPIQGGTSWADALTIAAWPGDTVVLRPRKGTPRVITLARPEASFIVFRGLVLDARSVKFDGVKITWSTFGPSNASHHIRIENSEVMNARRQGILVGGHHNEFLRLRVHDNGRSDFDHGLYITGADNLIDGCDVYRNAGWGVHVYDGDASDADRNVVRNSRIYDNARIGRRGAGVILSSGEENIALNNVIFGNRVGVQIGRTARRARVYNNTVFSQKGAGIDVNDGAVDTEIRNNLVFANPSAILDAGEATVISSNLVNVDPGVLDAATFDVRLMESSAAIDAGEPLDAAPFDHDGNPRPQGAGYDVGAYERR